MIGNLVWVTPLLLIALLEGLALGHRASWWTLSAVIWYAERRWRVIPFILGVGLIVLDSHLVFHKP